MLTLFVVFQGFYMSHVFILSVVCACKDTQKNSIGRFMVKRKKKKKHLKDCENSGPNMNLASRPHFLFLSSHMEPVPLFICGWSLPTKGGFKPNVVFDPGSTSGTGGLVLITS